jgi:hypothetical protein
MRNFSKMFATVIAGKRLILRSEHRWEDSIKMYLKEVQYEKADDFNMCGMLSITGYCKRESKTSRCIKDGEFRSQLIAVSYCMVFKS